MGINLDWGGEGSDTFAKDQDGVVRVKTNPQFYRPAEVELLVGDPSKASRELGWKPSMDFDSLVSAMVESDLEKAKSGM